MPVPAKYTKTVLKVTKTAAVKFLTWRLWTQAHRRALKQQVAAAPVIVAVCVGPLLLFMGFFTIQPNQARVLILFG
ncbi:MAG: hypothetical protein RRZ85_10805, partial [Gordonibacter sp.]